jgi:hypothetical protein
VEATEGRATYRYRLWDDASIRALLLRSALPQIGTIYEALPEELYGMRADLARLVILFQLGGLYADADTRVLKPAALLDYFERSLLADGVDAVVGGVDLAGYTRRWVAATHRPSNFLLGARQGSPFIAEYLRMVGHDFEALRIRRRLAGTGRWSRFDQRRATKRWAGPKQLRRLIGSMQGGSSGVRLTPVGFVACGYQRCYPDAAVAHDYRSSWYRASPAWRITRDATLYAFLRTSFDAWIIAALLGALCLALTTALHG